MSTIRNLFETTRRLDRRIEKVISFDNAANDQLKREITEYVVTDSIETSFERLLNCFDQGMGGAHQEIGIWVSGFYGSGKSSFTKYLGFALDPARTVDGKPFLNWLEDQLVSSPLRAQLRTLASRYPSTVIMIDLASAQIAGATMAEISSVLYWTVMQWAGYPKEKKLAQLQIMIEVDSRMAEFEMRFRALANGRSWSDLKNQTLVAMPIASRIASELYPSLYRDPNSFQSLKMSEFEVEKDRVKDMLELIKRKSGCGNIIFILDEVGQYVAERDNLILNLDGLAKNVKQYGGGKVWMIATAQQTLTEDSPGAQTNSTKLFKLKDRFPIPVELEARDIREICYRRLLTKSHAGEGKLAGLFDAHGPALRNHASSAARGSSSPTSTRRFSATCTLFCRSISTSCSPCWAAWPNPAAGWASARRSRSFKMCWWIRAACAPVNRCWRIKLPARWPRRRSFTTRCGTIFANLSVMWSKASSGLSASMARTPFMRGLPNPSRCSSCSTIFRSIARTSPRSCIPTPTRHRNCPQSRLPWTNCCWKKRPT